MLTTFRKFQKGALIVVTVIIVIAFAFLYSDFDFAKGTLGSSDCVIKIHKRCYRVEEAQKLARFQSLALNLGMGQFVRTLTGPNRLDRDPTDFVMNMLVLRKEAERLGIEPTADEIKKAVPNLPIFQQMPWANGEYMRRLVAQFGLTESDLASLVKDYLAFNKLQEMIGAGVQSVPAIVEKDYVQRNQIYTASVVNFDRADFEEAAKVTDEEVKKYFEERNKPEEKAPASVLPEKKPEFAEDPNAAEGQPEEIAAAPEATAPVSADLAPLMTAPQRGFDYIKFTPEKLAEDATQEEKAKSGIAFAKQVNRIYSELAEEGADFAEVTKSYTEKETSFKVETGSFEPFKYDNAPEALQGKDEILADLFSGALQKDAVSVPHSAEDGSYYVFKYSKLVEPRQMTVEEARPLIVKALKAKKSNQLASDAANEALAKLQKAIEEEKSILDVASASNYDLVSLPKFSEAERPEAIEDPAAILESVRDVAPGQLSKVAQRPGGKGYFISYVDKIEIYKDETKDANLRVISANAEREEETLLFLAWLKQRAKDSGAARNDSILNYPGS